MPKGCKDCQQLVKHEHKKPRRTMLGRKKRIAPQAVMERVAYFAVVRLGTYYGREVARTWALEMAEILFRSNNPVSRLIDEKHEEAK